MKRPVLEFVNDASISLKFSTRSATFISLCLSPGVFCLFFTQADWFTVSVYTKGKKKVRGSGLMFGRHLKGYQLFYEGAQIMLHTLKHPKETTFNR